MASGQWEVRQRIPKPTPQPTSTLPLPRKGYRGRDGDAALAGEAQTRRRTKGPRAGSHLCRCSHCSDCEPDDEKVVVGREKGRAVAGRKGSWGRRRKIDSRLFFLGCSRWVEKREGGFRYAKRIWERASPGGLVDFRGATMGCKRKDGREYERRKEAGRPSRQAIWDSNGVVDGEWGRKSRRGKRG